MAKNKLTQILRDIEDAEDEVRLYERGRFWFAAGIAFGLILVLLGIVSVIMNESDAVNVSLILPGVVIALAALVSVFAWHSVCWADRRGYKTEGPYKALKDAQRDHEDYLDAQQSKEN